MSVYPDARLRPWTGDRINRAALLQESVCCCCGCDVYVIWRAAPVLRQVAPGSMRTFAFRLRPHEELMGEITAFAKKHHIRAGIILTCVGSLEQVTLRYANTGKATQVQGHFEIVSLVGTFAEHSGQHIHLSVSDGQGTTIGGHMLSGNKVYTTAEIVVGSLDDVEFERELDPTYGYAELAVHSKLK